MDLGKSGVCRCLTTFPLSISVKVMMVMVIHFDQVGEDSMLGCVDIEMGGASVSG